MITTFSLSSPKYRRSGFVTRSESIRPRRKLALRFNILTVNVVILALIIFAGISYLLVINQSSVAGIELKSLERNIDEVTRANRQLELRQAELQSLARIKEAGTNMQMVQVTDFQYLPAVGSVVAAK